MSDYRMQLNNYVQRVYKTHTVISWDNEQLGPEHDSNWKSVVKINHTTYGTGTARLLDNAREEAARQALISLRGY